MAGGMMATITVKTTGFQETAVALGVHTPKAVIEEVRQILRTDMREIRGRLLPNVRGGVLGKVAHSAKHKYHGELARSLKAQVTLRSNVIRASAGSRFFIGRLWEEGFVLVKRDKSTRPMTPRKWAEPVIAGQEARVTADVEAAIGRGIKRAGL